MNKTVLNVLAVVALAICATIPLRTNAESQDQFVIGKQAYENREYSTALKILLPLAEKGLSDAQVIIGDMYNIGRGFQQDNSRAIEWYQKAAEQGNLDAIQMLGQGMRLLGESSP
ncbi:MAG: hypothetical protein VB913_08955 [Rhodospirillales bacterium]|jgi:hypothetical protein